MSDTLIHEEIQERLGKAKDAVVRCLENYHEAVTPAAKESKWREYLSATRWCKELFDTINIMT